LLKEASGKSIKQATKELLEQHDISVFDEKSFNDSVDKRMFWLKYEFANQLREMATEVGFESKLWAYLNNKILPKLLSSIGTDMSLDQKREELKGWVKRAKKGHALFVEALMGIGKTYSITEVLSSDDNLSAVIFLPTNRLCHEVASELKMKICQKRGLPLEEKDFEKGESPFDLRLKREYLENEVYWADGINEKECLHFHEIVKRYRDNWIKKIDLCGKCEINADCRFISHWKKAPLSRIVITSHQQYDHFHKQPNIRKWFKHGYDNRDMAVSRDFFIIDEDLVLSQCYQPIGLYPEQVTAFVSTITNFIEDFDDSREITNKIDILLAQINKCGTTSLVRPIDPEFTIPRYIVKAWEDSFYYQPAIIPEWLDWSEAVGNHLEIIENAIRLGFTVRKHKQTITDKHGDDVEIEVHMVYFPNPKSYDLSKLPPHIFFDGTKIDDDFLSKKLQNIKFKPMNIKIKPLWRLRVWQNINTDLTKKGIPTDKAKVETLIRDLIAERGRDHKYFLITIKEIRERYLNQFLDREFPYLAPVIVHYGNLKGINEANECRVGIMLGSFLLSDAVEIAMAMEFIQDQIPKKQITKTYGKLWKWKETNTVRVYEDDYADVGELSKTLRHSEQRQAIARTRYLFHDVDFYILSKDLVSDYELFLPQAETDQYRADLFKPRKRRSDADEKCDEIMEKVKDWLYRLGHDTVNAIDLYENYDNVRRQTAGKYLPEIADELGLIKVGKNKYGFPPDS